MYILLFLLIFLLFLFLFLFLMFDVFVFVVFILFVPLDGDRDDDFSPLFFFGSDYQLPLLFMGFKRFMNWSRCFQSPYFLILKFPQLVIPYFVGLMAVCTQWLIL